MAGNPSSSQVTFMAPVILSENPSIRIGSMLLYCTEELVNSQAIPKYDMFPFTEIFLSIAIHRLT